MPGMAEVEQKGAEGYTPREAIKRLFRAGVALLTLVVVGTLGYMRIEGWNFSDSLYMVYITMSTIGFTEVRELDNAGRWWTALVGIGGIGTFAYAAGSLIELAVEGTVRGYFRNRRMRNEIDKLENHYILCGYGRVGREVAEELVSDGVPFIVVDRNESVVARCRLEGYLAVTGSGYDDEVLENAGAGRARGLIAAVASDADNVFITLSARRMNPKLHIVARYNNDESAAKLTMAGADRTLSPHYIGGRRLASLATRPSVMDFLDVISHGGGIEFQLEEFVVPEESHLADHSISRLDISKQTGARILAIRRDGGKFNTNPSGKDSITSGDTLIVLGTQEQIKSLERLMNSASK
ncbi:MAG: potassium channel protein [Rubrobacteraceae bacterium]